MGNIREKAFHRVPTYHIVRRVSGGEQIVATVRPNFFTFHQTVVVYQGEAIFDISHNTASPVLMTCKSNNPFFNRRKTFYRGDMGRPVATSREKYFNQLCLLGADEYVLQVEAGFDVGLILATMCIIDQMADK